MTGAHSLLGCAVPDDLVLKVSKLTDAELAVAWLVNAIMGAVAGPRPLLYLQAAICQEGNRRTLKLEGMLE